MNDLTALKEEPKELDHADGTACKPTDGPCTIAQEYIFLNDTVFPSEEKTVAPIEVNDTYGGAHTYLVKKCAGFENGKTVYPGGITYIQFVRKNDDGSVIPGLQNEQLYIILIDRLKKLNAKFPDKRNDQQIEHLEALLSLCKERVQERIERGVMGQLKK